MSLFSFAAAIALPAQGLSYGLRVRDGILDGGGGFFSSQKRPGRLWGPPSLLLNGHYGSFPRKKRQGYAVNHPPPSSAEVKNVWCYTSAPFCSLLGVDRDD